MMLQYMRSKTGRCILLRENNGITILLELTDFKIMGYDLYGDYFEEVREIFGYTQEGEKIQNYVESEYGVLMWSAWEIIIYLLQNIGKVLAVRKNIFIFACFMVQFWKRNYN